MRHSGDRGAWRPTAVIVAAAITGAALTVLVLALTRDGKGRDPLDSASVTAAAVLAEPERFVGTTVRVNGRVTDVVAAQSVTLGPGPLLVLNIAVAPGIDDLADGDQSLLGEAVQVNGEVRIFQMDEIEAEVGVLDEEKFRAFSGLPVVIASSITPLNARVTGVDSSGSTPLGHGPELAKGSGLDLTDPLGSQVEPFGDRPQGARLLPS